MLSVRFAGRRAQASRDVQAAFRVARGLKSLAEWDADLSASERLRLAEQRKRRQLRRAAARWQAALDRIRAATRNVKQMGKIDFCDDPVKRHVFGQLRAEGRSRPAIQQQGEAAHAVWKEVAPAWKVLDELTVEDFVRLLALASARQQKHAGKLAAWRCASAALMAKARALDRDSIAWHAVVMGRFPAGTVEGDLILARVPTTTRPRPSRAKHKGAAIQWVARRAEPVVSFREEPEQTAA